MALTEKQTATLQPWDQAALDALKFNWGEAYEIGWDEEHGWWAARRDSIGGLITAPDPEALGKAISEDYGLRKVPRELPAEAGR